ncbi:sugar phosphate isomerase/epimerase family protein [Elusimicrobiota bacterium]
MKIGRNFTNMLETSYLDDSEKQLFEQGKISVGDMDARVQIRAKGDIIGQIDTAKANGLSHIELDGGIPNPFLGLEDDYIKKCAEHAQSSGITVSLHLPYTYVSASVCALQEEDRKVAVELLKKYIDLAAAIKCVSVVMHPGSVPFYQASGDYLEIVRSSLIKSLEDLYVYTSNKNIIFHLENNTAFDCYGVENEEIINVLNILASKGMYVKYCFDIGHWFTRLDVQKDIQIPQPPEIVFDEIPKNMLYEVHLNDYIPVIKKFHPPLHYEKGLLKRSNLVNLIKKFKEKGVEIIVVETAVREIHELLNARDIMDKETQYLKDIIEEC